LTTTMGNNHPGQPGLTKTSRLSKLNPRRRRRSSSAKSAEQFIIAHRRAQQANCRVQPSSQDLCRRVVFVSLMGLHQSWRDCPSMILYSSIFLLPLKREWIYLNLKDVNKIVSDEDHELHYFARLLADKDFVQLLRWKDQQGLAFWMKDEVSDIDGDSVDVAPFWKHLSTALEAMFDPVSGCNYAPLLTSASSFAESASPFGATREEIAQELSDLTMRFKSISEVLFQSNPTLDIVTSYVGGCPLRLSPTASKSRSSVVSDEEDDNTWWIAEDYDEEVNSDDVVEIGNVPEAAEASS